MRRLITSAMAAAATVAIGVTIVMNWQRRKAYEIALETYAETLRRGVDILLSNGGGDAPAAPTEPRHPLDILADFIGLPDDQLPKGY